MFVRNPVCTLYFIIFFFNAYVTEWVDMPQFSDINKIYRISSVQHDQFYKSRRGDANNNYSDDQRNGHQTFHHPIKAALDDTNTGLTKVNLIYESTTPLNLFPKQSTDIFTEIGENYTPTIDVIIENKLSNKCNIISPSNNGTFNISTIRPSSSTTYEQKTPQNKYYNDTSKQTDGILQYLPIDILKNVHYTLQSQPESVEGKMHFLKMFEKTLMTEIEFRLATVMTPNRKIRGADHYGHGYDDHDDHSLGFPSIEGALMAISFLTFAVYLVRLVMLLFQNMNNPMTTTTAATLFLGKKRRSTDFDDNTAEILNNINSFVPDF